MKFNTIKHLLNTDSPGGGGFKQTVPSPKGLTPEQPKEPPKEVLSMNFNMDDSLLSGESSPAKIIAEDKLGKQTEVKEVKAGETQSQPEVKKEEKKVEEKKEEQPKSVLKPPTKKEEKKEEKKGLDIKDVKVPDKKQVQRDYTGFSAEEQAVLKQMSNEAFDFTTKLLKQNKELSSKSGENVFLQHPEAYTLSPEFRQAQQQIAFANREMQIWQEALANCKQGKPFKPIIAWDNQGNPVFGAEIQPTDDIEEKVRMNLNQCVGAINQRQANLQQMASTFNQRAKNDLSAIQAERANRFQWVKNPEVLDYTLEVQTPSGPVEKSVKQIKSDFISIFPPYMQNNPGIEVASDLMVSLIIAQAELAQANAGRQIAETQKQEIQRAEPSSQIKPAAQGKEIGGVKTFSLEGMPA